MKHTKIYGALIIIAIAAALFLLVFFGVNIKVTQSVAINVATTSKYVSVYLEGKQQQYVKEHSNNVYYIYNPVDDIKTKCYLKYSKDNLFDCKYANSEGYVTWSNITEGVYPSKLDFGSMKIFEYFIML